MWETLLRIWNRTSGGLAGPIVGGAVMTPQLPGAIDQAIGGGAGMAQAAALAPARLFSRIGDLINEPIVAMFWNVVQAMETAVAVVATVMVFIYLLYLALGAMYWQFQWSRVWWAAGSAFIPWLLLLNPAAANTLFVEWFLYTIPSYLADAAAGAFGAGSAQTEGDAFGHILSEAMLMGVDLWRALGFTEFGAALMVILLMATAIVSISYTWWINFKSGLWLVLLFAIFPFPLLCAIWPATRGLFFRWVDTVWGFVMLKLVAVVFVVVLLGAEGLVVAEMIGMEKSPVDKVLLLICAVAVFVAFFCMALDIPRVAASIGGGTVMHGRSAGAASFFVAGYASRAWSGWQAAQRRMQPAHP